MRHPWRHVDDAKSCPGGGAQADPASIAPGAIRTSIKRQAWETQADLDRLLTLIRYRRIGEPEEIVRAAVWLASDEANCFVGTTLIWMAG